MIYQNHPLVDKPVYSNKLFVREHKGEVTR